jgi:hypothetical protein
MTDSPNASPRRQFIPLLIGIIATLGALAGVDALRENRCLAAGGRWNPAAHSCAMPADASPGFLAGPGAYLLALPLALFIGLMLWRIVLLVTGRGGPRRGA